MSRVFAQIKCLISAVMFDTNLLEKEEIPWKWLSCLNNQNFHKSKADSLKKLQTRACLIYDLMHFKGRTYTNHKISCDLSCALTILLAFHKLFMILGHIKVYSKYHLLMVDSIQIWNCMCVSQKILSLPCLLEVQTWNGHGRLNFGRLNVWATTS